MALGAVGCNGLNSTYGRADESPVAGPGSRIRGGVANFWFATTRQAIGRQVTLQRAPNHCTILLGMTKFELILLVRW